MRILKENDQEKILIDLLLSAGISDSASRDLAHEAREHFEEEIHHLGKDWTSSDIFFVEFDDGA